MLTKEHISFSELSDWCRCPYYHKKVWLEKERAFEGNEHTSFGTAVHHVCETIVMDEYQARVKDEIYVFDLDACYKLFLDKFESSLADIPNFEPKEKLVEDMKKQVLNILPGILPALKKQFGFDYEVLSVEMKLYEPIATERGIEKKYKGFIDLIIAADDKLHVLDWKTCSWGWKREKKTEKMVTYQLTYYKNYAGQALDVDPENIKVYFALLKRTAKKDNVEIFEIPCGSKKIKNALKLLDQAVYNIESGNHPKNKTACKTAFYGICPLYETCMQRKGK